MFGSWQDLEALAPGWLVAMASLQALALPVLAVPAILRGGVSRNLLEATAVGMQILGQIPITPGGLGFVEAGLTAMPTLAGVSAGAAVLATLAYRLFSYWLPLPVGLVAFGWHARRYRQLEPVAS